MKENSKKYDKYEIEAAADTLLRADKLRRNAPLMKEVEKELLKRERELSGLKDFLGKQAS